MTQFIMGRGVSGAGRCHPDFEYQTARIVHATRSLPIYRALSLGVGSMNSIWTVWLLWKLSPSMPQAFSVSAFGTSEKLPMSGGSHNRLIDKTPGSIPSIALLIHTYCPTCTALPKVA